MKNALVHKDWNYIGPNTTIGDNCEISNSYLEHVEIGEGSRIIHCQIRGLPNQPIRIGKEVELIDCQLENTGKRHLFEFGAWQLDTSGVSIGDRCRLHRSRIEDAQLLPMVRADSSSIRASIVGAKNNIRPHANLSLSATASACNLGSELSKTIIEGDGFVSEHTGSYLSLVAPAHYPLISEEGQEILSPPLPNLTNIGAGTVFANYSGEPLPAAELALSKGSMKGTALVFGAFTAVNSVIVNRYGQLQREQSLYDLLRRRDLTILGLGCFVEKKITGRIPSFSYSGATSAKHIDIGWVLEKHPGILLNILQKMRKQLGSNAGALRGLVDGTIRLELQLLNELRTQLDQSLFTLAQLDKGIACLQRNLDGRWDIDDHGNLLRKWQFDHNRSQWYPSEP